MQISIKTTKESLEHDTLGLLNGLFKLTDREMQVMEYALKYDTKIAFGTECRKTVTRQMEFSSPHDIGNYVKRLKRKNVVFKDNTGDLRFNPLILGVLKSRKLDVQFTINNDSSEVL